MRVCLDLIDDDTYIAPSAYVGKRYCNSTSYSIPPGQQADRHHEHNNIDKSVSVCTFCLSFTTIFAFPVPLFYHFEIINIAGPLTPFDDFNLATLNKVQR